MTGPDQLPRQARAYLDQVDHRLRDLAPREHADLLSDVVARLAELEDDHSPAGVLGPPSQFADDLRHAAGLAPSDRPDDDTSSPSMLAWLQSQAQRPAVSAVFDYVASLRPAWWALRGYLLFALGLVAVDRPEHWGLHTLGHYTQVTDARSTHDSAGWPAWLPPWLLLVIAAVIASIVLGRVSQHLRPAFRLAVVALDMLAVFVLVAWPTWWLAPSFASVTSLAG